MSKPGYKPCSFVIRGLRKVHDKAVNQETSTASTEYDVQKTAALYVHWPYCKRRCTYCNFNKYIDRSDNEKRMCDNLVREAETLINLSGVSAISSIFFGGGTPSLASPDTISRIICQVKSVAAFPPSGEITLEANPTALETSHLKGFRDAGVNRLSLGVQTLKQDDLFVLGRDHTVEESLRCIDEARRLFPGRVSVDLMFGRPGQNVHSWKTELKQILNVCDNHLSLYQLTLERGTHLFKAVSRGTVRLPSHGDTATMYQIAVQNLAESGYERYEVSNFAKERAYSDHNLTYWRGLEYIGVGPVLSNNQPFTVMLFREGLSMPGIGGYNLWAISRRDRKVTTFLEELLAVGLRTKAGISHDRWGQVSPASLHSIFSSATTVKMYISQGLLQLDHRGLCATAKGLDVLDTMIPSLLIQLEQVCHGQDIS